MQEFTVNLRTLTPLWTGDAWRNNNIRPSAIMGNLRFWFETICFFSGIVDKADYHDGILVDKFDYKTYQKALACNGLSFKTLNELFNSMKIPIPSRIFGMTYFKSKINIKKIEFDKNNFSDNPKGKIINGKNWYWKSPSYQGEFSVTFEVQNDIVESIFYPLLNFMDQYGFWGGGWNIGYGRLKIDGINGSNDEWKKDIFEFSKFNKSYSDKKISDIVIYKDIKSEDKQIENLLQQFVDFDISSQKNICYEDMIKKIPKKIIVIKTNHNKEGNTNEVFETIKELIQKKAEMRSILRSSNKDFFKKLRHSLFGKSGEEGSKILPWINKEGNEYVGGLMSIGGLIKLKKEERNNG